MGLEDLLFKIRRRDSLLYSQMKNIIFAMLRFDFPAPRIIFRPIYEILVLWRYAMPLILCKFIYCPIFRSRCETCGKGLLLYNGIPWIEGNLKIRVGENVSMDHVSLASNRVHEETIFEIGDRSGLGYSTIISVGKSVKIGKDCLIANNVFIADNDGHPMDPFKRLQKEPVSEDEIKPVIIEDNVWIGAGSVILKGVTIGTGSVVSANSVVTRSIPPYSIVMGAPARIIISGTDKIYQKSHLTTVSEISEKSSNPE